MGGGFSNQEILRHLKNKRLTKFENYSKEKVI